MKRAPLSIALAFGFWLVLSIGCQFSKEEGTPVIPMAKRVLWQNRAPAFYSLDSTENPSQAYDTSQRFSSGRRHQLDFVGSDTVHLILHEFAEEYSAYAAFAENATRRELEEGFFQDGNRLVFYHGRFVGEWRDVGFKLIPGHFFQSSLAFKGEELFSKPPEFQSFPLLGRIANSERVILKHFLGKEWLGPVFSMQYHCNEDTATVFRGFPQSQTSLAAVFSTWIGKFDSLSQGGEIRFQGQNEWREPLHFWTFKTGMVGIVGCFDQELALSYVEKMKKMTFLWKRPRFLGKNERMN